MSLPLVSVVVPVKNETEYLELALTDLCAQSWSNLEIIIADDGSEQATVSILEKWKHRDPRIKVYHQPSAGQSAALNLGIRHASGEFIAIADADDRYRPLRIEKQAQYLQNHPDCHVCGCLFTTIPKGKHWELPLRDAAFQAQLPVNNPAVHPGLMYRAALLKNHPYAEDVKQSMDYHMLATLRHQTRFANVPFYGVQYRLSQKSPETLELRKQEANEVRNRLLTEDFQITEPAFHNIHNQICNLEPGITASALNMWISRLLTTVHADLRSSLSPALHAQAYRYLSLHEPKDTGSIRMHLRRSGLPWLLRLRHWLRLLR